MVVGRTTVRAARAGETWQDIVARAVARSAATAVARVRATRQQQGGIMAMATAATATRTTARATAARTGATK